MEIISYFDAADREEWLKQIGGCGWTAGQFLYRLLSENAFHDRLGRSAQLLLLADGTRLASTRNGTMSRIQSSHPGWASSILFPRTGDSASWEN